MAWPSIITKVYVDQGTDDPSQSRQELENAIDAINSIINNRGVAGGIASIDASGVVNGVFPSGTKLVFMQAAAPTGWTIDTSFDGRALFFKGTYNSEVKAGGATGGIHGPGLMDVVPSHTHVDTGHTHVDNTPAGLGGVYLGAYANTGGAGAKRAVEDAQYSIGNGTANIQPNAGASNWAPKYACGICASKG